MILITKNIQKKVALYIEDTDGKGLYPLRRALTIAQALPKSVQVLFIGPIKWLNNVNDFQFYSVQSHQEFITILQKTQPDLLVRDSGSTSKEDSQKIQELVPATIHFDDFGEGGKLADFVIQTLYTETFEQQLDHYVIGMESFIADAEIAPYKQVGLSKKNISPLPHLVVTFGDEDASNLTYRTLRHLSQLQIPLKITILIGENYAHDQTELRMMALGRKNTVVQQRVENVGEVLAAADIILCSSGYTPYEVGVMGIPCIVLAQNEFEATLDFPSEKNGFIHLGLGRKVKQSLLLNAVMELLLHDSLRKKAIERQMNLNLGEGKQMVCEAILYFLEYPKRERTGKEISNML